MTMSDPQTAAWLMFLRELKTEPLERGQLAEWFCVSERRLQPILDTIPGVERIGRRWRVPVSAMPPQYLAAIGLMNTDKTGQTPH